MLRIVLVYLGLYGYA